MISKREYDEQQKRMVQLLKARNKALSLIDDAKARYIKEKTRSRSKKAALEKDAALNSPRFQVLKDYDRREDIQESYGYDFISASERDRLEDLWDEREEIMNKTDDKGVYSDDVTKALYEAYIHIADIWEDEIEGLRKNIKEFDDIREEEIRSANEYEQTIKQQYDSLFTNNQ